MKIRWKVLIVVIVSLLIFLSGMNIIVTSILRTSYSDLENDMSDLHMSQTIGAIEEEESHLRLIIKDYSNWDDSYHYVTGENPSFIEDNFIEATFVNLQLTDIAIFNGTGDVLFADHYDNESSSLVPCSASLIDLISADGEINQRMSEDDEISGIINLDGELTIFACRGIFHSDQSGPVIGYLWFSETISDQTMGHISQLTSHEVFIEPFDEHSLSDMIGADEVEELKSGDMVAIEESEETMMLYRLMDDHRGNPAMLVSTPMAREVAQQGEETLILMQYSVLAMAVVLLTIIMLLLEMFTTRRIMKLDRDVDHIGRGTDAGGRVGDIGDDEISSLAGSINTMLGNLENAQRTTISSEARHREILADLDEMVFRFDGGYEVTFANESFWRYYGMDDEAGRKVNVLDIVDPEDIGSIVQRAKSMNEGGQSSTVELRSFDKAKEQRWHQWTIRPIFDDGGSLKEYQAVAQDITEQKKAVDSLKRYREELEERVRVRTSDLVKANDDLEEEIEMRRSVERKLIESQRQYQAVVEDQTELIVRLSPSGTINFMNEAFSKYFRLYDRRSTGLLFKPNVLEEDQDRYYAFLAGLGMDHPVGMIEFRIDLDGEVRWQQWNVRNIYSEAGELSEVQVVGRDITQWKLMEKEVAKAETLESLGMLAGGMAHEFNNVLTSVLGNITLAKNHLNEKDPLYERLESTERSVYDAKKLTDAILTFADGGEPIKESLDSGYLMDQSEKDLTAGSSVTINNSLENGLWNIEGDLAQLIQAVRAVVKNAVESMPNVGTVDVKASNLVVDGGNSVEDLAPGRYVKIEVTDRGNGISKENLPHIFDPYFGTKRSTGLGLSTALSIIKRHRGTITVGSIVNVGSKFVIYLSAASRPAQQMVEAPEDLKGNERILLMDDDEGVLEVGEELLRAHGFDVDGARTGEEAMIMYRSATDAGEPYDLVIMDLTIKGGKGGKETIKELLDFDPDARAIFSSGYSKDPVMAHYQEFGFKGVVKKPYLIAEMTNEVRRVLDQ
jgi:PAS domain S-box-containing protein